MKTETKTAPKTSEKLRLEGMGAIPHAKGTHFRVWAPHARQVYVVGSFNNWKKSPAGKLTHEENGYWAANLSKASTGQEYRYLLETEQGNLYRIDPYGRQVTNSVGNTVIYDGARFDWQDDHSFRMPASNQLVIYEMHIGTFHAVEAGRPGNFASALRKLPYLERLGINAIEVMPPTEFSGDFSWGYNPAHPFAVESIYGGPDGFKEFVRACHSHGIGVILDVVYNHFGPSDLDLWQFDGWSENGRGGIYFYNDWRAHTPWGETRPDYGRPEVRQYIRDNALMWIEEFHVDGLRFDMTPYIRSVHANSDQGDALPDGILLLQRITEEIHQKYPGKLLIAEDMHALDFVTAPVADGGLGFDSQWDSRFVHPIREALIVPFDEQRDLNKMVESVLAQYNGRAFNRVVFTESHDEVANGSARVAEDIAPGEADSWPALKRAALGGALVQTVPGIPMLFQGQALHEDGWFTDTDPLDWSKEERFKGINHLYTDLISLRLNKRGLTPGLSGPHVEILLADHQQKLLAYCRWEEDKQQSTVVVLNFSNQVIENHLIVFPAEGRWYVHFNSDWDGYNDQFSNHLSYDPIATTLTDGVAGAPITIAPYTALILSQKQM